MQLIIGDPYDWNTIMLKKKYEKKAGQLELKRIASLPSPEMAKINSNAKLVGQWLGIDIAREWSQHYDRVWDLYQYAKIKTNSEDINKIIGFLSDKLNQCPSMNGRRIDDLYVAFRLDSMKPVEEPSKEESKEEEPKDEPKEEIAEETKEEVEN